MADHSGRRAGPPQARPDPLGGSIAVPGERGVVTSGRRAGPPQARPDPPGGSIAVPGERGVVTTHLWRAGASIIAGLVFFTGCASTEVQSQWVDPQLAVGSLRGAKVLVVCEAYDIGLKRSCEEQMASEVFARGATAVIGPDTAPGAGRSEDRYLDAARAADARAVLAVVVSLADTRTSPGFSIGVGGFGIGGGSVRGGVGVSVPIGGHQLETGHAANGRVTDAKSGGLLWTARATTPPSRDFNAQMGALAKAVLGAADKGGLF